MAYQDYRIAAGHNNAAGLVNIEAITTGGLYFPPVRSRTTYEQGQAVERADGTLTFDGKPTVEWVMQALEPVMYSYLKTTYCAGGYSGLVTIRTRTDGTTYANFNALLRLPMPNALRSSEAGWYDEVALKFIRMEAL